MSRAQTSSGKWKAGERLGRSRASSGVVPGLRLAEPCARPRSAVAPAWWARIRDGGQAGRREHLGPGRLERQRAGLELA